MDQVVAGSIVGQTLVGIEPNFSLGLQLALVGPQVRRQTCGAASPAFSILNKSSANGVAKLYRRRLEIPSKRRACLATAAAGLWLGACSGMPQAKDAGLQPADAASSADVAVRSQPVVPGRPARVFIFAALGDQCQPIAAPVIKITALPAKGEVSLVPGQDTTIATSAKGTCIGRQAKGTGLYYTARAGAQGTDTFAATATLANGESQTRTFGVTIAE
jgi:hypothetical protein